MSIHELIYFKEGDRVLKHTGDYQLPGTVLCGFLTKAGKARYVVEHDMGILHIYSDANLKEIEDEN